MTRRAPLLKVLCVLLALGGSPCLARAEPQQARIQRARERYLRLDQETWSLAERAVGPRGSSLLAVDHGVLWTTYYLRPEALTELELAGRDLSASLFQVLPREDAVDYGAQILSDIEILRGTLHWHRRGPETATARRKALFRLANESLAGLRGTLAFLAGVLEERVAGWRRPTPYSSSAVSSSGILGLP